MLANFDLKIPKERRKELQELVMKGELMQVQWRTKIADLVKGDVADKDVLKIYETLLQLYSLGSEEYRDVLLKTRDILFAGESPP
jgi:hypothetical protein